MHTISETITLLNRWHCTRGGPPLFDRLKNELLETAKVDISLTNS